MNVIEFKRVSVVNVFFKIQKVFYLVTSQLMGKFDLVTLKQLSGGALKEKVF